MYISVKFRQFGVGFTCALPERAEVDFLPTAVHTHISSQLRAGQEDNLPLTHTGRTLDFLGAPEQVF